MPPGELILGRPPADPGAEIALSKKHGIGWIVSKDSGGQAAAKIENSLPRRDGFGTAGRAGRAAKRAGRTLVPIVETAIAWIEAGIESGTLFRLLGAPQGDYNPPTRPTLPPAASPGSKPGQNENASRPYRQAAS